MGGRPSETVIRAWARLIKAQQLALLSVERALKAADLPPLIWYDVLLELERAGREGLRPFKLKRAVLMAQSNLSRLIDRIEQAGYVERRVCANDARGQLIGITKRGKAVRQKMWPVYARAIEAAVGKHLSVEQAEALEGLLGLLIEAPSSD
jgi:DNA-binding MarR family transcriptional regulator